MVPVFGDIRTFSGGGEGVEIPALVSHSRKTTCEKLAKGDIGMPQKNCRLK